jgi:carbonic anhydrase
VTATDELLRHNVAFAATFDAGHLTTPPAHKLAVVTCMDARIEPGAALGLTIGDAHLLRNAGGVVTDAELRALAISQRVLGTEEVVVIRHTDCGMARFDDAEFADALAAETGTRPTWPHVEYGDLEQGVRADVARIRSCPYLLHRDRVRGFVYDVRTGALREVS